MLYIHQHRSISPQKALLVEQDDIVSSDNNVLHVIEPKYEGIPLGILRRMGKAVRMGVGAAIPFVKGEIKLDGILIGTANGGMEDCIKFLNQVIEFEEGTLTPTNFVQSTTNAVASQLGLLSANKGYNVTHVNRGLAFENAVLDVMMLLQENPDRTYLLGGVEEISTYNYNIDFLADAYKKELISSKDLYNSLTEGTIAGEGVAMFVVNDKEEGALVKVEQVKLLMSENSEEIIRQCQLFLKENQVDVQNIDLFLTGENGDTRSKYFYEGLEQALNAVPVARFKHLTGDFATASALSLSLACSVLEQEHIPVHMLKDNATCAKLKTILIYNNHKGLQHSFMLISKV